MLLYRKEPTFIQTHCSSLESKVLDFNHTNKDWEYRISSCQQFWHTLESFFHNFWKRHPWHLNHFQWGRCRNNSRNNSRTCICHPFLSALHTVSTGLLYFFCFLSVLNCPSCHVLSHDWKSCDHHFSGKMATYNRQNMCENAIKIEAKSRE